MSKHTPGPWSVGRLHLDRVVSGTGEPIASVNFQATADTVIANARLIAAAPDLLDACNASLEALSLAGIEPDSTSDNPLMVLCATLVSATAKVTGDGQ